MAQTVDELTVEEQPRRQITTANELNESLRAVIDYNWTDEQDDYIRQVEENDESDESHVFSHLKALDDWLGAV